MRHPRERGMATAEYTVGTLGAVLIAAFLFKLGLDDSWFFERAEGHHRARLGARPAVRAPQGRPMVRLRPRMTRAGRERGMVTAEMAVLAPFGVAFGLLLLWIVSLGFTQVQLVDAAREAARLVARGEPVAAASDVARRHAPPDADGSCLRARRARDRAGLGAVAAAAARAPSRRRPHAGGVGGVGGRAAVNAVSRARFGHDPRAVGRDGAVCRRDRHGAGGHGGPAQAPGRVGGRPRRPRRQSGQPGRRRRVRRGPGGGASQRRSAGAVPHGPRRRHRHRSTAHGHVVGPSVGVRGRRPGRARLLRAGGWRVGQDRVEQLHGSGLVERLVAVAALGRVHARRAAVGALAGHDRRRASRAAIAAATSWPRSANPAPPG